jgi:hypothetical protein
MIGEWIETNDELPEIGERVIVASGSNSRSMKFAQLAENENTEDEYTVSWIVDGGTVSGVSRFTHWMPLPEPPVRN